MRRKLSVVGRGTAGCLAIIEYANNFALDEIEWIYDPDIPTASVGEGTTHLIPEFLTINMGMTHADAATFNSTFKTGIRKTGWNGVGDYRHSFAVGSCGMHFSAIDFQKHVFNKFKENSSVKILEKNVDIDSIDSDYIMVCSGSKPDKDESYTAEYIPVNAAYVKGYEWEHPYITETLCIASAHGWVFVIPLQNRCSFGYIYNKDITTYSEMSSDFDKVINRYKDIFKLKSQIAEQSIAFSNYLRKENFTDRIVYNGNASFFLEPLEATSTAIANQINTQALTLWDHTDILTAEDCNNNYLSTLTEIEAMICLHYFAGSKYDTEFWKFATSIAEENIRKNLSTHNDFSEIVVNSCLGNYTDPSVYFYRDVGTWNIGSYIQNIYGLGIRDRILEIAEEGGWHV